MSKAIKFIRSFSFVIIIIQLLILIAFAVLYFNNIFGLKQIITPFYVIVGCASLVAFDCLFVWIVIIKISGLRRKTDLHAAEVIGNDVQEAYNFAMVGLVVTDDNDIVIWTNALFEKRHIDIIDSNILTWQPKLVELKQNSANSDATTKILINSRYYEVKYLLEAGLWIFKDIDEKETTQILKEQQAPVIGILTIDNYQDVTHGDTEDFNDGITKVKNEIFQYTKEHGVLLRKFKDDSYSLLCDYKSYEIMKKEGFTLLDKVRKAGIEEGVPLTVSIGIALNYEDFPQLNESATDALEIAISRGGDQIVISNYGHEMEFIGGKTEAQEKRNRANVRVIADSLFNLIKNASKVLVMGHIFMDMDALGACLGVHAIAKYAGKDCKIVADLKLTELKTRAAFVTSFSREELSEIKLSSKDAAEYLDNETLLIVVDVHRPDMVMAPNLLEKAGKIVVIDHHRRSEIYIEPQPVLSYINPAASSTCELLAEIIRFCSTSPRIELNPTYATIMLSGIFLDSSYFKSKHTGMRTFEACTILKDFGADNSKADDYLKDEKEEYFTIVDIIRDLKFPDYGVVYACADDSRVYEKATLAKAANTCLTMKGVKAAFIIGKIKDNNRECIGISCRSDGTINVQLLAEKMGGGGHFTSAAAQFDKSTVSKVEDLLIQVLETSLSQAKADARANRLIEEE